MNRKRSDKESASNGEANVLPVLNIMFLLIPALLLAMEVASFAAVHVTPPQFSAGQTPSSPTTKNLKFSVTVTTEGYSITIDESPSPNIPRLEDGVLDLAKLESVAGEMKTAHPENSIVYLSAENDISLQELVSTMDALRGSKCKLNNSGEKIDEQRCLFWNPVIEK